MILQSRRGVALVLVLWIVVILAGVSAGVVRSARTSTGIAIGVMQRVREGLRQERLREAFDKNPDLAIVQDLVSSV